MTIVSNDLGNFGDGNPLTDTDSMTITIVDPDPINNDPPINHLPAPVDTLLVSTNFSLASNNAFSVTDVDAGSAANFQVFFSSDNGVLTLINTADLTVTGLGTTNTPLAITGPIDVINARLANGLLYTPFAPGRTSITIRSDDQGNTGLGGPKSDSDTLEFNILSSDNAPPVNRLPADFTAVQLPIVLAATSGNALSVSDIDAGQANNFLVSLTASNGWLRLANSPALNNPNVLVTGEGTTNSPLQLQGTVSHIDQLLAQGLVILPLVGAPSVMVQMTSDDRGNTGNGGPKTDSDQLVITISDSLHLVNDPPVNFLPPDVVSSSAPVVLSASNRNQLYVADIDAGSANDFTVTLTVGAGQLAVFNSSQLSVAGNGTSALPLTLVGSLADINHVLAGGLTYLPNGHLGTTTLTIRSDDRGNTVLEVPRSIRIPCRSRSSMQILLIMIRLSITYQHPLPLRKSPSCCQPATGAGCL